MQKNSKKGFTLVEIMIVVVIIGLLAAMAVPAFQQVRERSLQSLMDNNARQISAAANQYFLDQNENSVTIGELISPVAANATTNTPAIQAYLNLSERDLANFSLTTGTVLDQGDTFDQQNANVQNNATITYFVDTGRVQPPSTTN